MNKAQSNTVYINKWSAISRIFHWISALLLLMVLALIFLYENTDNSLYIGLHKAFGISLLFWMIARVINRIFDRAPPAIPMPKWQQVISQLNHFALYVLLIAMPMAGLLMSVYGGRPVDMFGLFEIPVFITPDRGLARTFNDLHTDIIWPLIIVFTLLHIGAALHHQFIKKDKLMNRIL